LDRIEKKPLAHFFPGSFILSVGSFGCNLHCPFCQNWQIAQQIARVRQKPSPKGFDQAARCGFPTTPEDLVESARGLQEKGNIGIAFTYNEPLVGYEFVCDTAALAKDAGLKTVLVTNAYANASVFASAIKDIDATNIDLKAFTQEFYDNLLGPGGLEVVKRNIAYATSHCHVEVTTLIVPGLNDDPDEVEALACWLADIDSRMPLHLTRFHPAYKMPDAPPTPKSTMYSLGTRARRHLEHVHLGNM
jgi:pyruvate formate lyase activating enzyme